ncbi:MAG: glycosyltransferase family 4 protein, partial [Actinobacteria bacterium]|nr:glycosyltransferase family 4 protein [Actinomycetota bacterium]
MAFERLRLLQERGHEVVFLCAGEGGMGCYAGVRVIYLESLPAPVLVGHTEVRDTRLVRDRTGQVLAELRRRLACFGPDIIDVQNGHRATPAMARAALRYSQGVRAVLSPHSFDVRVENHGTWSIGWDGIIFDSEYGRSFVQG